MHFRFSGNSSALLATLNFALIFAKNDSFGSRRWSCYYLTENFYCQTSSHLFVFILDLELQQKSCSSYCRLLSIVLLEELHSIFEATSSWTAVFAFHLWLFRLAARNLHWVNRFRCSGCHRRFHVTSESGSHPQVCYLSDCKTSLDPIAPKGSCSIFLTAFAISYNVVKRIIFTNRSNSSEPTNSNPACQLFMKSFFIDMGPEPNVSKEVT